MMEWLMESLEIELIQGIIWDGVAKVEARKRRALIGVDGLYGELSQSKTLSTLAN